MPPEQAARANRTHGPDFEGHGSGHTVTDGRCLPGPRPANYSDIVRRVDATGRIATLGIGSIVRPDTICRDHRSARSSRPPPRCPPRRVTHLGKPSNRLGGLSAADVRHRQSRRSSRPESASHGESAGVHDPRRRTRRSRRHAGRPGARDAVARRAGRRRGLVLRSRLGPGRYVLQVAAGRNAGEVARVDGDVLRDTLTSRPRCELGGSPRLRDGLRGFGPTAAGSVRVGTHGNERRSIASLGVTPDPTLGGSP